MASETHRAALSQDARDFVDAGIAEGRAQQAATRRLRRFVAALTARTGACGSGTSSTRPGRG